ncbi:MAG: hypothetical protein AB7I50_00450 [Vicinamibacterales bacterium]
MKTCTPEHAALCRQKADVIIEPLRARARELGYALGVHGSLARDIDLIAVPWTDDAVPARELAEALLEKAVAVNGLAWMHPLEAANEWHQNGCQPHGKPHGRHCWSFHLGGGPYIDLSVMPRLVAGTTLT